MLDIWVDAIYTLETLLFVIRVKVAYISNKPPLVGEHALKKLVVAFQWVVTSTRPGGFMVCVCIKYMKGESKGSTGFMEKPY